MRACGGVRWMGESGLNPLLPSSPKQQWRWLFATFFRNLKSYRMQNEHSQMHTEYNDTWHICPSCQKCILIKRKGLHFCHKHVRNVGRSCMSTRLRAIST